MGKFQKIKKSKRLIREFKYSFHDAGQRAIKEEIAPLVLSKIANNLNDYGKVNILNIFNI